MNIGTSSSTTVSSSNTSVQSGKSSSSKTSSSASFDEELKNVSETQETENGDKPKNSKETENSNTSNKNESNEDKTNQELKGEISQDEKLSSEDILAQNIKAILDTNQEMNLAMNKYQRLNIANIEELSKTLSASVDYTRIQMDDNDALFFSNLVQNTDMSMQSIATEIKNLAETNIQQAQKTANVSATLMNALKEGIKTNQPFRIDFDKDISVIIKINKDGSIAANFIPGDKAVEEYLKMNISTLRQKFDQEELSYSELTYSRSKREQQENKRKNKGEQ